MQSRITSQLVALATQLRNASGLDALDELNELLLDDEPVGHSSFRASRQLVLPREELELDDEEALDDEDDDPGKQVPHLAMMLSTALSHLDASPLDNSSGGQPVTNNSDDTERTNPRKARFMSFLPNSVKEF